MCESSVRDARFAFGSFAVSQLFRLPALTQSETDPAASRFPRVFRAIACQGRGGIEQVFHGSRRLGARIPPMALGATLRHFPRIPRCAAAAEKIPRRRL
jgi:hypothetical protein